MSLWRILVNKLTRHSLYHLFIPLFVGVTVERFVDVFGFSNQRWLAFFSGVFFSYGVIMYFLIRKERRNRIDEGALAKLQDTLDHAKHYYGLSVIPLAEWFDPTVQVYLAKLLNRKLDPDDFEHERTLLFFSNREYRNARADLVDENHYGRCLAHLHRDCDIPLSFLRRDDIFVLLDKLDQKEKEALGCYPRWTDWRPLRFFRKIPLRRLRGHIRQLDFAVVTTSHDEEIVLRVSKRGGEVRIADQIENDNETKPYRKLIELIRGKVYDSKTNKLLADYDFIRSYGYEARARKQRVSASGQQELRDPLGPHLLHND